jgi:hypothetical protein
MLLTHTMTTICRGVRLTRVIPKQEGEHRAARFTAFVLVLAVTCRTKFIEPRHLSNEKGRGVCCVQYAQFGST